MAPDQDFEFKLTNTTQLDVIDKLRELGVSDFVALPQLVVVGDQSSGKSSILEALLGLPFARDSGLCTRFATQITMRRTDYENISISIIPSSSTSADRSEKLRAFKQDGLTALSGQEFLEIFEQACKVMNISVPGQEPEPGQTTFSKDVLKIELCGPDRQNLSIIDIPGIFRSPTPGVTTKDDMLLVETMVRNYITDERTVILAVLPAPTDIATQSILTMAEEVDPLGLRTLGVLTKPDLVDKGAEQNVIDLVLGRRNKLHLGYCIVRNRGQAELSTNSLQRSSVEDAFFSQGPWSVIDKDRVGVSALKGRLEELLADITRREYPKVKLQIDRQLASRKESLAALGPDRHSSEQQRRYLQEIAIIFQKITDFAIDAYYSRDPVFDESPALRLPTMVVNRNDEYANEIERRGHTIDFRLPDEEPLASSSTVSSSPEPAIEAEIEDSSSSVDWDTYAEVLDLLPEDLQVPPRRQDSIIDWIEHEYRKSRGRGLESMGPSLLPILWQQQSKNWEVITLRYLKDVLLFVHAYIDQLLHHVCRADERTRAGLASVLADPLLERYRAAVAHVKFLIHVERFGTPLTQNHYFADNLQAFRLERIQKALEGISQEKYDSSGFKDGKFVKLEQIAAAMPMGNVEHTVLEIHSILKAYYKVARKRFVDTVCMQGTDYHLLSGDNSPLRIFSPLFVAELSEAQLESIAGEDPGTKRMRKTLEQEIASLEKGRKLLRAL